MNCIAFDEFKCEFRCEIGSAAVTTVKEGIMGAVIHNSIIRGNANLEKRF